MLIKYKVPASVTPLFIHCGYTPVLCFIRDMTASGGYDWFASYPADTATNIADGTLVKTNAISVWEEESVGLPISDITKGATTKVTVKSMDLINIAAGDIIMLQGVSYIKSDGTAKEIDQTEEFSVMNVDQATNQVEFDLDTSSGYQDYAKGGGGAVVLIRRGDNIPVPLKINRYYGVEIGTAMQTAASEISIYTERSTMSQRSGNNF